MINDKGKACFAKNEGSEANFGGHDASLIFLAMDNCPTECIKEIG